MQGGIKNQFYIIWYDTTWDWTQVSRTIGEHSTYETNVYIYIYIYIYIYMCVCVFGFYMHM